MLNEVLNYSNLSNGILGSMQTNGKSVESQLMRRFCREQELDSSQLPDDADFLYCQEDYRTLKKIFHLPLTVILMKQ